MSEQQNKGDGQSSTNALDIDKGPCGICDGEFSEHGERAHVWVPEGGQLMTREEQEKKRSPQKSQGALPQGQQQQAIRLPPPGDPGVVNRLIEVLLEKEVLSTVDALYVAGYASKPDQPELTWFRDPII